MLVLIIGIIVFLGVHTLTALRETRAGIIGRIGLGAYKGVHSLLALLGFVLIVWGFSHYRAGGLIHVWSPPVWTRHLTISLMWFAFVALACVNPAPSRIRGWLRHPMLVAIKIWALAHLLANGDAGGMLLFGSFLAWAVFDRIAVKKRGDLGAPRILSFTRADAINLIVGSVAYVAMIFLHPILIGVPVILR
ncbi:MAG: NnrU family protein [Beijerinckiaceae bacterium]|nr:NnrU family protein [Beijerinckiaceae bacterium]